MKTTRLILSIVSVVAVGIALIACDPQKAATPSTTSNPDAVERPVGDGSVKTEIVPEGGGK